MISFQSRARGRIVVLVAAATVDNERQNQPSLPRLEMDALIVPALKSRAKLTRTLPRPGKDGCVIVSNAISVSYSTRAVLYRFRSPMLSSHTIANQKIKLHEKEPSMNLHSSKRMLAATAAIVALLSLSAVAPARKMSAQSETTMNKTFVYPTAKKVDQIDDYHGVQVADPYRWLEDPDSADSRAWIEAQNKLTFGFLNEIPERAKIKERLTKLWNYEKYMPPFKEGDRYFYFKNDGLQNQNVLFTLKSLDGEPRVLLDPNKLS